MHMTCERSRALRAGGRCGRISSCCPTRASPMRRPPPRNDASRRSRAVTEIIFRTPITFDVGDRLVHSPMVHVAVKGVTTKLILDTGSTDHVFTMDLAGRAGLDAEPCEPGTDHAGAPVPSWTLG